MRTVQRILIVDDDPFILESLKMVFGGDVLAAFVRTAKSGKEALSYMASEPFALILTDYKMPQMDGLEFLARARQLAPSVPSILMTGFPEPGLEERARKEGAKIMVTKPFELEYLVAVVKAVLEGKPVGSAVPRRSASAPS